ncbi:MAG: amidohydrolase family protein, partial [Pseudomonadales bacterium]|nr:amidohydrolase family protein [Pseudomonadales bacterium]
GSVLAPELRLSRDQALRAVTIEAARAIQMEHEIGSIKIGKQADFTVLDENPYPLPIEKLHQVPVFATVLSGEIFLIKN